MESNIKQDGKMIDVLCVTSKLCHGGVQTFLMNNVELLMKHGVRLNFAVQTREPQVYDDYVRGLGCRIFAITPLRESKIGFMRDIRKILKSHPEIQIIHSHMNFANAWSLVAAKGLCRVRISHSHNSYPATGLINKAIKAVWKALLPAIATEFWGCSSVANEWLHGKHARNGHGHVVYNAIDAERYTFNPEARTIVRKQLGIADDETVYIHTGSFSKAKNHLFLLEVFAKAKQDGIADKLILCGDGALRQQIEGKIRELEISDAVIMVGNVNNCQDYLSAGDIMIFPSLFEGFPLSLIEAQCSGLPIVASEAAVPRDGILAKCETVAKYDIGDWISALSKCQPNPDRANGKNEVTRAGFDIKSAAENLAKLYKQTLSE